MKIILDENIPEPLSEPLGWLLRGHRMAHVNRCWKGIKDQQLYDKAKRQGYDVVISNDSQQLYDSDICKAIQRSNRHVVFVESSSGGLKHLAAVTGALMHCIRDIIAELEQAESQRIVIVPMLHGEPKYRPYDPRKAEAPSPMWPRKQHGDHKPSRPRDKHSPLASRCRSSMKPSSSHVLTVRGSRLVPRNSRVPGRRTAAGSRSRTRSRCVFACLVDAAEDRVR